jgi:hypothetical protein
MWLLITCLLDVNLQNPFGTGPIPNCSIPQIIKITHAPAIMQNTSIDFEQCLIDSEPQWFDWSSPSSQCMYESDCWLAGRLLAVCIYLACMHACMPLDGRWCMIKWCMIESTLSIYCIHAATSAMTYLVSACARVYICTSMHHADSSCRLTACRYIVAPHIYTHKSMHACMCSMHISMHGTRPS